MRLALFADIHANREAFEACLADAARRGADRIVLLGDLVGYGADPAWVVARAMALREAGAIVIKGNHDEAAVADGRRMSEDAARAAAWTRGVLDAGAKAFLAALPMQVAEADRLYVHASAHQPARWPYLRDAEAARRCLAACDARIVLCGHVHVPALYGVTATMRLQHFLPADGAPVPLARPRRWLGVLGAVGQPRDGNPAACYAMLDDASGGFTTIRVPYDIAGASAKIREAGLPPSLAARLFEGR
jgi:diadenosine tetraphosphatase ApaH/serine/threonine PP2A family protein phosphatase